MSRKTMLALEKKHFPLLITNVFVIIFFSMRFIYSLNYEFLIYVGVVTLFAGIITYTHQFVRYSMPVLCLLSAGIFLHLAGGSLGSDGIIWYENMIYPISETYNLIRYDQLLHMFGFFTATLLSFEIIKSQLKTGKLSFGVLAILMMAGCGFGALNEVIEFLVDQSVPVSGVGGYINTSVDLVVNLIGSILGVVFIKLFLEDKTA